jgi:hypothetical protein
MSSWFRLLPKTPLLNPKEWEKYNDVARQHHGQHTPQRLKGAQGNSRVALSAQIHQSRRHLCVGCYKKLADLGPLGHSRPLANAEIAPPCCTDGFSSDPPPLAG